MHQFNKALQDVMDLFEGHKYGRSQRPMMEHLTGVVSILRAFGYNSEDQLIVGIHHDTLEDTEWDLAKLSESIGRRLAYAVYLCSDGPGDSRKVRKGGFYAKWEFARNICQDSRFAEERSMWVDVMLLSQRTKLGDRLFNARSCVENGNDRLLSMYKKEHSMFEAALKPDPGDPLWMAVDSILGV